MKVMLVEPGGKTHAVDSVTGSRLCDSSIIDLAMRRRSIAPLSIERISCSECIDTMAHVVELVLDKQGAR